MGQTKNAIKIKTYDEFVEQLTKIKESDDTIMLAFYKFCWDYKEEDDEDMTQIYKELVEEVFEEYGLKPFKITENLDLIFKFKRKAEAIVQIKPRKLEVLIYKQ